MKSYNTFAGLIPYPQRIVFSEKTFPAAQLRRCRAEALLLPLAEMWCRRIRFCGVEIHVTDSKEAEFQMSIDDRLSADCFTLEIAENGISLAGGDHAGVFYGLNALTQILAIATAEDMDNLLQCGTISDRPRFRWRGFMLDSARHRQTVSDIKRLLELMAFFRLNVFHWHLTDNQSWCLPPAHFPELSGIGTLGKEGFSASEIAEITAFAKERFITVVPELDLPGHCRALLNVLPGLRCPNAPSDGRECCIGNEKKRKFMKRLLDGVVSLFPDTACIHIGGDEGATADWTRCPDCLAMLKKKNFSDIRELERDFLQEMIEHLARRGKKAVAWGTGLSLPRDTAVQIWRQDGDAVVPIADGNPLIFSLHRNFYFDYPERREERLPAAWMPLLSLPAVYATEPFAGWENLRPGCMLGVEACLWTENVPARRLFHKVLPRLLAFSECAWSFPQQKSWDRFQKAVCLLQNSGLSFC